MQQTGELTTILEAGALLIHTERAIPPTNLKTVLTLRISQYRARIDLPRRDYADSTLEQVQQETATEALSVVERVQAILDKEERFDSTQSSSSVAMPGPRRYKEGTPEEVPVIGTRDLAELRTLLAITFKWGVEPLLVCVQSAWPTKRTAHLSEGSRIIDLTSTPEDYGALSTMSKRLMTLLFPRGVHGLIPQTLITSTLLNRHVTELLRPGIALGWVPKSLATESIPVVDELRPLVMRLLSMYV